MAALLMWSVAFSAMMVIAPASQQFWVAANISGICEVVESWVAQIAGPELGDAYLGTQGDVWDAKKI